MEERNFWSLRQLLLKSLCMDLLKLTPFELQQRGGRLKGTRDIQGGTELSGIRVRAGVNILPHRKAEAIVPLLSPPLTET